MQREEMLAKVQAAYLARQTGDFAALGTIVAENAAFSFAGEQSLLGGMPGSGDVGVHQAARELFEAIELRGLELKEAVAEGNKIALLWRTVAVVPENEPFETLMFDLWEFDQDGKISKGTQFLDTAKFAQAMRASAKV